MARSYGKVYVGKSVGIWKRGENNMEYRKIAMLTLIEVYVGKSAQGVCLQLCLSNLSRTGNPYTFPYIYIYIIMMWPNPMLKYM